MALLTTESIAQDAISPPLLDAPRHQRIRVYSTKGSSSYNWYEVDIDCQDKTADVKGDIWGWRPIYSQENELENGFREACHSFPASGAKWSEQLGKIAIARTCNYTCIRTESLSSGMFILKELYCMRRARILAEASFYSLSDVKLDTSSRFVECKQGERAVLTLYSLNNSVAKVKLEYKLYP